jgi:hypothetical protein
MQPRRNKGADMETEEEFDVNSPEFFEEFAKALSKQVEEDRKLGLIVRKEQERAA